MRKTMQKHLRKTESPEDRDHNWTRLHKMAVNLARDHDKNQMADDLERHSSDPETVLRRYSIISMADLKREFPQD